MSAAASTSRRVDGSFLRARMGSLLAVVPLSRLARGVVLGSLVVSTLLIATTMTFPGADRFGKLAQVYGAYTWAFVVLIAGLIALLRGDRSGKSPARD